MRVQKQRLDCARVSRWKMEKSWHPPPSPAHITSFKGSVCLCWRISVQKEEIAVSQYKVFFLIFLKRISRNHYFIWRPLLSFYGHVLWSHMNAKLSLKSTNVIFENNKSVTLDISSTLGGFILIKVKMHSITDANKSVFPWERSWIDLSGLWWQNHTTRVINK